MSNRSHLSNVPAVSFTVRKPSPLSRETSDSDVPTISNFTNPKSIRTSMKPSPLAFSINSNGKRQATKQSLGDESDSMDEEVGTEDEIITGFNAMGVQR